MYKVKDSLIENAQKQAKGNRIFNLVLGIAFLLVLTIFVFSNFILISVYVDGTSMDHTLHSGEVIFANKTLTATEGDIIVIDGEKVSADGKGYDWLIKRAIVIGKKDKTMVVEIKEGKVWVGEKGQELSPLKEDYLPSDIVTLPTLPHRDTYWEIEEGEIFYLGDNRKVSKDSRSEYGTCKTTQVVGVVPEWALSMRFLSMFIYDVGLLFAN